MFIMQADARGCLFNTVQAWRGALSMQMVGTMARTTLIIVLEALNQHARLHRVSSLRQLRAEWTYHASAAHAVWETALGASLAL